MLLRHSEGVQRALITIPVPLQGTVRRWNRNTSDRTTYRNLTQPRSPASP
jgi:hypothetical protein